MIKHKTTAINLDLNIYSHLLKVSELANTNVQTVINVILALKVSEKSSATTKPKKGTKIAKKI